MSIKILKDETKDLKKEITLFLRMVCLCQHDQVYLFENHSKHLINRSNQKVLKATVLLMLYNLIEATITKLIKEITNEINNNSVAYIDLIDNVKKAWIKIHCRAPLLECKKENFPSKMHEYMEETLNKIAIKLEIATLRGLISGNADSENIKKVCFEYGIKILKHCSELDMVKQKRNELAHGESRFTEVGGNITESELKKYKEAVYQHLDLVIKSTEKYLKNKEYKKTS